MTVVSPGMGGGRDQVVKAEVACGNVTEWSEVGGRLWGTVGGRDQVVKVWAVPCRLGPGAGAPSRRQSEVRRAFSG